MIAGDYLGEKNDFNEQVLKAFVELHDFTNLILVQALRWVNTKQIIFECQRKRIKWMIKWNNPVSIGNFYGHFDYPAKHRRLIEWWNALRNAIVN